MTGKERAGFRAQANTLEPLFQIGKEGVTQAVVNQLEDAFNTRELVKIKVHLETSPTPVREAADRLAAECACDVIQVIGGVIVLYRYNKKLHEPKKTPAPAPKKERVVTRKNTFPDRGRPGTRQKSQKGKTNSVKKV